MGSLKDPQNIGNIMRNSKNMNNPTRDRLRKN